MLALISENEATVAWSLQTCKGLKIEPFDVIFKLFLYTFMIALTYIMQCNF